MAWDVGTRLTSELTLIEPLAEGAMGELWIAEHSGLGRRVAVKFLSPKLVGDKAARGRFRREAEAAMQLRSPFVVRLYGHGTTEGWHPFLVFELLEGESLGTLLLREDRLDLGETLRLVRQVGSALGEAHSRGIIHRDIKADNVFVIDTPQGPVAKVLDFGMAKRTQIRSGSVVTATGVIVGTPEYMSPEQVLGSKQLDHRTDLWSLGVLTYRALLGAMPFDTEGPGELVFAICRGQFRRPSELFLPKALDEWFERALAPELDARFATAGEMVLALERIEATPGLAESIEAGLRNLPTVMKAPAVPWQDRARGSDAKRGRGPGSLSSAARRKRDELPLAKTVAASSVLDAETQDRLDQQTVARPTGRKEERRTLRYVRSAATSAAPSSADRGTSSVEGAASATPPPDRATGPSAPPPAAPSYSTLPSAPPIAPPVSRPSYPSAGPPSYPTLPSATSASPPVSRPSHPSAAASYPTAPPSVPQPDRSSHPSPAQPSHPSGIAPSKPSDAGVSGRPQHVTLRLEEGPGPASADERAVPSSRSLPPWIRPATVARWPGSKGTGGPTVVLGGREGGERAVHRKLGYGVATLVVVAIATGTALAVGAMVLASLEGPATAGPDAEARTTQTEVPPPPAPSRPSESPRQSPAPRAATDGATAAPSPTSTGAPQRLGYLAIDCKPSCTQIVVDGRSLGPSPVDGAELKPGRKQVTLKRRGREPQVEEVEIVAGQVTRRLFVAP